MLWGVKEGKVPRNECRKGGEATKEGKGCEVGRKEGRKGVKEG